MERRANPTESRSRSWLRHEHFAIRRALVETSHDSYDSSVDKFRVDGRPLSHGLDVHFKGLPLDDLRRWT